MTGVVHKRDDERLRLAIVGVGGQGVLTAARILGEAARLSSLPVVIGQLHGMSQRGGSVASNVLFGPGNSSFIGAGRASVMLGLEPMEVLWAADCLGPSTTVIVNRGTVVPFTLSLAGKPYPDVDALLDAVQRRSPDLLAIDGPALVERMGNQPVLNTLMLGVLAGRAVLPLKPAIVWQAIEQRCRPGSLESNRQAFECGLSLAADALARQAAAPADAAPPTPAARPAVPGDEP